MDTENSKQKNNGKHVIYTLFILLIICNVVIFVLAWEMKTQLNDHGKINITLSPDLKTEIIETFKQTANNIKSEFQAAATAAQIVANAEKKNAEALGKIDKQVSGFIADTEKKNTEALGKIDKQVSGFIADTEKKNTEALGKIDKQVSGFITNTEKKNTEALGKIDKQVSDFIANAKKKNTEILEKIDKQLAQIIVAQNQLRPELVNLNKNIESVVQAAKKNHSNAEMAIAMAKKAAEQGEIQLAMVYALNAINHESSNIAYIKFYNDLLVQKQDLAISDIDQFVNVLDLAVFQVAASDVSDVISIKTAIIEKRSSIISTEAEAKNREVAAAVAAGIAELKNGRLAISRVYSQGSVNEFLLKERIEALTALLADASISQEDRENFTEDLSFATGLYSIATTTSAAKNAIAKARVLANRKQLNATEILTARNQLQTANTLLSQIWSSDGSKYQNFASIAEQLQEDIATIDKELNIIASDPAKKQIENLITKCHNIKDEYGKYTSRINKITEISKEFPQLLSSIYDLDLRKALASEIESLTPFVSNLSKERYKAYQEWAIEKLNKARKKLASYNVVTDKRAEDMFNEYILEINPALLLPDVNSLYNNIYQIIYNELPNKAEMQYKKATYENVKQLEDF